MSKTGHHHTIHGRRKKKITGDTETQRKPQKTTAE
jgi:hypothetical protein